MDSGIKSWTVEPVEPDSGLHHTQSALVRIAMMAAGQYGAETAINALVGAMLSVSYRQDVRPESLQAVLSDLVKIVPEAWVGMEKIHNTARRSIH